MKIYKGSKEYSNDKPLALTIGNFDGVHIGHQETIRKTIRTAKEIGGVSCAMIFDPHPRTFFNENDPQELITTIEQRLELLEELGLEEAIIEPFDSDFASIEPREFIETILVKRLGVDHLLVSSKFRFGHKAQGNLAMLKSASENHDFQVTAVENVYFRHTVVSSSFIRNAILDGEMEIVRHMLGRPYTLHGQVYPDTQRGTNLLNTPTSNIKPENDLVPALGVYASIFEMDGIRYPASTYIGTRPTFDGKDLVIETHIIGFEGDLYGKKIDVELLKKTRADRKFNHLSKLLYQIKTDISESLEYLKRHREDPQVGQLKWPQE